MSIIRKPIGIALVLMVTAPLFVIAGGLWQFRHAQSAPNRTQVEMAARKFRLEMAQTQAGTMNVVQTTATQLSTTAAMTATTVVRKLIPTPAPTLLPTAIPAHQPAQATVALTGFSHFWQTWNNCGPATLAMNMSYYGSTLDQALVGAVLRRHPDDKNVSPEEMAAFARSQGYSAQVRVNGSTDLMRLFLSNGIPVLIETWLEPEPNDGMGHYRMLTGFDDASQRWIGYDSYVSHDLVAPEGLPYRGIYMPYAETDLLWSVFNRTYVLIYDKSRAPIVQSILGGAFEEPVMWQEALRYAQAAVNAQPTNAFAWFNLGSVLNRLGDYASAAQAFDRARQIGLPWRMLWYQFGPFQTYTETGRYQDVAALANATLKTTQSIEELYYWQGRGLAGLGNQKAARQAWERALSLNPDFTPAAEALAANAGQ